MKDQITRQNILKTDLKELFNRLDSSENGLTSQEAARRLNIYGANTIKRVRFSAPKILLKQFQGSFIYLLAAAALISYWIKNYLEGTIILAILLINSLLSFFQEYSAEKTTEKLAQFITTRVRVKRNGEMILLDQSQIVPGDVIVIKEGDMVPADLRLFNAEGLQINESQLTGESIPVIKRIFENQRTKEQELVFAGSVVEKGFGAGMVYATGYNSEFGKIAKLSSQTKRKTQYEKSLSDLGTFLMRVAIIGLALVFIFKLVLNRDISHFGDLLLFVIATAVAVVPEALPVITTVSLSRGALRLAKKHVVVRRLSSVEDLGNVDLLCTDKTGTITENKMVIKKITSSDADLFQKLAYASITPVKGRKRRTENSYDDAFLNYVSLTIEREARNMTIEKELPFDPEDRRRRVLLEDKKQKKHYLVVIGAPEILLKIASYGHKKKYLKDIEKEGMEGLHHLALAYKEVNHIESLDVLKNERGLTFLGYVSLYDPLRHTAKNTIRQAERLGVKVKILTGDRREVAEYIGREIGLLKTGDKVYLGSELSKMSEEGFKEAVLHYDVFARVSPTQKYEIIKALKETNAIAYQGDGINDAPSLKLADVAIAVNSATDIAKESADIVILNESLEVIINGIKYGRSIFVNINKFIVYTMISNFGNFMALSAMYLISVVQLPILPVQILLGTLIPDTPLISIASDSVEDEDVIRPERHNVRELMFIPLILGLPTALFEVFYYLSIRNQPAAVVQTSLFVFFNLTLIVFYAIRNKRHFWKAKMPPMNLNILFTSGFIFSIAVIYIPTFQNWFSFVPLPVMSLATILLLMAIYFFIVDLIKVWYYNKLNRAKNNVN